MKRKEHDEPDAGRIDSGAPRKQKKSRNGVRQQPRHAGRELSACPKQSRGRPTGMLLLCRGSAAGLKRRCVLPPGPPASPGERGGGGCCRRRSRPARQGVLVVAASAAGLLE